MGDNTFKGTIYWTSGFVGKPYVKIVRLQAQEDAITVNPISDTAIWPLLENCRIPILQ